MKQVECNKCGKVFEVEDNAEWGYCPFCESDNVEVKKNLEDLIDEAYDDIDQTAYKKESMALAYHGNCAHYFQYPEDYEQDLESEVERLQEELVKKDKEITQRLVIQEKDYYEELNEIKQQLAEQPKQIVKKIREKIVDYNVKYSSTIDVLNCLDLMLDNLLKEMKSDDI